MGRDDRPEPAMWPVKANRIVAVGSVDGPALREIDAEGKLVTPGWVDIHTHYDGQATWDPEVSPSGWHGVTTMVMGNCGVGFAPARAADREMADSAHGRVWRTSPGAALSRGMNWDWESFPEGISTRSSACHGCWTWPPCCHTAPCARYVVGEGRANGVRHGSEEIAGRWPRWCARRSMPAPSEPPPHPHRAAPGQGRRVGGRDDRSRRRAHCHWRSAGQGGTSGVLPGQ